MCKTPTKHKEAAKTKSFQCAVITISTSKFQRYQEKETLDPEELGDKSGRIMQNMLEEAGHTTTYYCVLPDDRLKIRQELEKLTKRKDIDVIITSGGTGIAPHDYTWEAMEGFFKKEMPGFGELFRILSYENIKSAAMLSRARAGIKNRKIIFCMPGSPAAVQLAMSKLILPELPHLAVHLEE